MKKRRIFLNGKTILIAAPIAIISTISIVYLTGISSHRSILDNSLISLSFLGIVFFLFLTIGLFRGLHIHDDLSHKLKLKWGKSRNSMLSNDASVSDAPGLIDTGDEIESLFLSIIIWIVITILFIFFLVVLEFVLSAGLVGFIALLYWILIRALKLIFSKSVECEGNLLKSITWGAGYTFLYLGWLYGVVYISMVL